MIDLDYSQELSEDTIAFIHFFRSMCRGDVRLSAVLHQKIPAKRPFKSEHPNPLLINTFVLLDFKYRATAAATHFINARKWGHRSGEIIEEHSPWGDSGVFENYRTVCEKCKCSMVLSIMDGVPDVYRIDDHYGRATCVAGKQFAHKIAGTWDYNPEYFEMCPHLNALK